MGDDNTALSIRAGLIQAVKTPLGFFVLTVLVVEAVMGGLAFFASPADRTLLIWGTLILLLITIALVFALAWFKPEELQGRRPDLPLSLSIAEPLEFEGLDVASISWDENGCFLVGSGLREPVQLVPTAVNPRSLLVHISQRIKQRISPNDPYHLELRDTHGLRWRTNNFYFFASVQRLIAVDGKQKVLSAYCEEEY